VVQRSEGINYQFKAGRIRVDPTLLRDVFLGMSFCSVPEIFCQLAFCFSATTRYIASSTDAER